MKIIKKSYQNKHTYVILLTSLFIKKPKLLSNYFNELKITPLEFSDKIWIKSFGSRTSESMIINICRKSNFSPHLILFHFYFKTTEPRAKMYVSFLNSIQLDVLFYFHSYICALYNFDSNLSDNSEQLIFTVL